jgi:hypothetical protein
MTDETKWGFYTKYFVLALVGPPKFLAEIVVQSG